MAELDEAVYTCESVCMDGMFLT